MHLAQQHHLTSCVRHTHLDPFLTQKSMKRSRLSSDLSDTEQEEDLDPLAVALLALGRKQQGFQPAQQGAGTDTAHESRFEQPHEEDPLENEAPKHSGRHSRRDYVWRGKHRQELLQRHSQPEAAAADGTADGYNSNSRRSSATHRVSSDDDEVAQQQQLVQWQQQAEQQRRDKQKQKPTKQRSQKQQEYKDNGKEWAALTTWLRMNLHHPRTFKRVLLFLGHRDVATGSWMFSLNPDVTWQEVGIETKLRLKTLPVEVEQAYLQKYPGRPRHEWGGKVQRYKPPGSSVIAEITLWEVVHSLHNIYVEHEGLVDNNTTGQQEQQQQQSAGLQDCAAVGTAPQQQQLGAMADAAPQDT